MAADLYVHFPFCRAKCSYCALYSRVGVDAGARDDYVRRLASLAAGEYSTVYFGGGSPALCDLRPILEVVSALEFTVELHPLDVTEPLLATLKAGGVNRISMGVQSLDDRILADMGRGYDFGFAERAFALVKRYFDNAGIDLIVGYPGETAAILSNHARLADWGLAHCSVYALQNERGLKNVIADDALMDRLAETAEFITSLGLRRYEISNYALPGRECRHNLAVWRGADYLGLGEGACGRIGLTRTFSQGTDKFRSETLSPQRDATERRIFRLRLLNEGLDAAGHSEWLPALTRHLSDGLLTKADDGSYRLTARGCEVCDSILTDLV